MSRYHTHLPPKATLISRLKPGDDDTEQLLNRVAAFKVTRQLLLYGGPIMKEALFVTRY